MEEEKPAIKVTDRRMFTETGELREAFEQEASTKSAQAAQGSENPVTSEPVEGRNDRTTDPDPVVSKKSSAESDQRKPGSPRGGEEPVGGSVSEPGVSEPPPGYGENHRQPQFLDLVAMLAEPAALFLGDATMPDQEPIEDLERARMHIDLLGLLEQKCQGNLNEQESAVLKDLVYRLRLRYVEKRG